MRKHFELGAGVRAILKNAGWIMGEQIIRLLAGLFVGVWIARHLGPANFGILSYSQAVAGLVAVVASLGFNRMVVRELVEHRDKPERQAVIMMTVFVFRLTAAVVLYLLAVSLLAVAHQDERALLMALVGISILTSPFDCADQYFQSQSSSRTSAVARSSAFFVSTGVKVILLLNGAGLHAFAGAIALEYALNAAALFWIYRRYGLTLHVRPEWRLGRAFLRETWPDIIAAFSVLFFMRSGQLMLESMRGASDVGIYSAAARLSEAWNFIPTSLAASSFPRIVQSRPNAPLYYTQISRLMIALVGLAYLAGIAATLLSEPVVRLLYGETYAASAPVLSVHIWCGVLVGLGSVSGNWLLAERKLMLSLQRAVLGMIVSVLLNLVLIPRFGPLGAAWSTFFAMASAYYIFDLLHPATRRMFIIKTRALVFMKSTTT